jgi:phosphoglucomutase
MSTDIRSRAEAWLSESFDADTRKEVQELLKKENEKALTEAFYKDLEFGTGGLRGIMGVGTNRMNIYTVGMATQGLANYMKVNFKDIENAKSGYSS